MMKRSAYAAAAVVVAVLSIWHFRLATPTAIVLASVQSDTLDGMNGVDPIAPALRDLGYEVYSLDLPCHGEGFEGSGLVCWADRIAAGEKTLLSDFCAEVSALIDSTGARRVQMVGVSRGGYVAYECGAQDSRVTEIAQIAPVVDLGNLYEFDGVALPASLSLEHHAEALAKRGNLIRIGAADDRVGTADVVAFGESINAEIQLLDSIGHRAPDPENIMAKWLRDKWSWPF